MPHKIEKFEPDELVPNTHPEATVTYMPTMYDYANDVESAFLITEVTGT